MLALVATAICSGLLGATLGLFFAGIFVCALLVPSLVVAEEGWTCGLFAAGGVWLGVSLVWLEVTVRGQLPGYAYPDVAETLACVVIAAAFVLALGGLALLLRHVGIPRALASFLAMLAALAWLAWPVWASPWIAGHDRVVAALVAPHPMLAVNAVLQHLGLWNQQPLAYNLTVLNQDAYLPLPRSILPCALVHTVMGAACMAPILRRCNRERVAAGIEHGAPAASGPSPLPARGQSPDSLASPLSTGERG